MPININAKLNVAINAQSLNPAITTIQNAFKGKKIPLEVELKIPKEIDREVYRANRAFQVLDQRLISLKIHAGEALGSVQAFVTSIAGVGGSLNKTLTPAAKSLDTVARSVTAVTKTIDRAEKSAGGLAEAVGASTKRFVSFAIAAGSIANVVFQLEKGFSAALQFDRELVKFKQIGNDSTIVIKGISDEISKLAKNLGVSSNDLIRSAITLRQAGLSAKETKIALEALAKTSLAPTFDSISNTTEAVIATLAQFGKGAGNLEKQLGSINRVSADFAVESSDLTEAIRRTGGAFAAAGGNLEELIALFTSVRATTRESADSIATAFRTIFARLQRPETIRNLRDIGVELENLEGRFVGPFEAVNKLNQAFGNMPKGSTQFAQIVEEIGGIRQVSKVIPLIQQFPIAIKAYNAAIEGQSSLSKDAAIAQEAFLNKIQKLKESFLELFRVIVSNDAFSGMLNFLISSAKAATDLAQSFKPLIPLLTAFAGIKLASFVVGAGASFKVGYNKTRFADGGVVPAVPNSGIRVGTDTVPAVLTEGEYVIKRSAAQKIGYDTLDQLNAYADGGIVSVNNRKKAAMLVMNKRYEDSNKTMSVTIPVDKLGKDIQELIPKNADAVSGSFTVAGPSARYQKVDLKDSFKNAVKNSIAGIAKSIFNVQVKKIDDSIYSNVVDPQGQGRLFEAVLQSIAGSKIESNNQIFDFPKPIHGKLAKIFPASEGKYGESKLSQNSNSETSMIRKMIREFGLNKKFAGTYKDERKKHEKQLESFKGEARNAEKGRLGVNVISPLRHNITKFASGGVVGGKRSFNKIGVLQSLLDSFGIKLNAKNLVRKLYISQTRKGERGSYNPQSDSIFISKDLEDNIPSLFHELGHAIDYKFIEQKLGRRSNNKSVAYSSQNIPAFQRAAEIYKKDFINLPFSMTGGRGLKKYDPRSHDTESFANAFTAYSIFKGARAGKIDPTKYPQFEYFVRTNPKSMVEIISIFEKLIPHLKDVKYLPINRKDLKFGRLDTANKLRDIRKGSNIGAYAGGGIVGSKFGGGRGIRTTGGGIAVFGGRKAQLYAKGSFGGVKVAAEDIKSNFDDKFLQEIITLTNTIEKMRNQIPLSPHYGLGLNSNLPPIPIDRDTPSPISLSSQNYSGIPLSEAPSKGISSNLPPIKLDQDITGIPLTTSGDRIRSSYLNAKRSGYTAAQQHFGGGLTGMSGTIELGSTAKDITSGGKSLSDNIKSAFNKISSALKFSSKQVVEDSTKFSVEIVDGVKKVVGRVIKNGKETVFATEKSYLGDKQAGKSVRKIEDLISSGKVSAEDILASGKFNKIGVNENKGRFKNFFDKNGSALSLTSAIVLPGLSENVFGNAEKPGALGVSGAKYGGAAVGGIEGALLSAQVGAAFGPVGMAVGGIVGALGSVVFSLNQFDEELKRINEEKISKSFSELNIDPKTGLANNKTALNDLRSMLKDSNLDLLLDPGAKNRINSGPRKDIISRVNVETGLAEYGGVDQDFEDFKNKYDSALKIARGSVEDFYNIIKNSIVANPNKDINDVGDKLVGNTKAAALLKVVDPDRFKELENFQKEVKRSADITAKIAEVQAQAYTSMKDLNTAMEVFSNTVEQAGEKFQKNLAFNAVGSDALTGKVSAGSTSANIGLFSKFGKDVEDFAKPGGQLDEARTNISKAIKYGLELQKGEGETVNPEDIDKSASKASSLFLKRDNRGNGFSANIASAIEDVLASNYGNTSKIPKSELLGKLTEDVVNRFKNIKTFRDSTNKQLEGAFNTYSQQVGNVAERRSAILQRRAENSNKAEEFGLVNLQTKEDFFGNQTRFGVGGAISSADILARAEIQTRQKQRGNQLNELGIEDTEDLTGFKLKAALGNAQEELSAAQSQQKNATNLVGYQAATNKIVDLTNTVANLKKGMDLLANSTSVLDAKNKALNIALDQQKRDFEGRKSDAEILTFGTAEEKQRLAYKEQLTQTALQNPAALQFATDEEKQLIRERLKESDINRSYQEYDKYGRERGIGFVDSKQQLEGLINPILQQLLGARGAQYNRNRTRIAQNDVEAEQALLNANAKANNSVEYNDVNEQRKLLDQNFNEYIKNINDGIAKNADTFNQFSDSVNRFSDAVNRIPTSIILQSTNDHNVNVAGIDRNVNAIKKIVQEQAAVEIIKFFKENKILTEDSVA